MKKFLVINLIVILVIFSFVALTASYVDALWGGIGASPGPNITITYVGNNGTTSGGDSFVVDDARTFWSNSADRYETSERRNRRDRMRSDNTFTRTGYTFDGWQRLTAGGVAIGDVLPGGRWLPGGLHQDTTFRAEWRQIQQPPPVQMFVVYLDAGPNGHVPGFNQNRARFELPLTTAGQLAPTASLPFREAVRAPGVTDGWTFNNWFVSWDSNNNPVGPAIDRNNFMNNIFARAGGQNPFTIFAAWDRPTSNQPKPNFVVQLNAGPGGLVQGHNNQRVNFTIVGNARFDFRPATHPQGTFENWYWEPTFQNRIDRDGFLQNIRTMAATNSTGTAAAPAMLFARFSFHTAGGQLPAGTLTLTLNAGIHGTVSGSPRHTVHVLPGTTFNWIAAVPTTAGFTFLNWAWSTNTTHVLPRTNPAFINEIRNRAGSATTFEIHAIWQPPAGWSGGGGGSTPPSNARFVIRLGHNLGAGSTGNEHTRIPASPANLAATDVVTATMLRLVSAPQPGLTWTNSSAIPRPGHYLIAWITAPRNPQSGANYNLPAGTLMVTPNMTAGQIYSLVRSVNGQITVQNNVFFIDLWALWAVA